MRPTIVVLLASLSGFALAPRLASAEQLNEAQIRELLSGNTFVGTASAKPVSVQYFPDGKQVLSFGSLTDVGKWEVKDDKLCSTWPKIRDGKVSCFLIERVKEKVNYIDASGNVNSSGVVKVGH